MKVSYPKKDESLVEFPHHCQRKKSEVMLCPSCSSVFDKKAVENIKKFEVLVIRETGRTLKTNMSLTNGESLEDNNKEAQISMRTCKPHSSPMLMPLGTNGRGPLKNRAKARRSGEASTLVEDLPLLIKKSSR